MPLLAGPVYVTATSPDLAFTLSVSASTEKQTGGMTPRLPKARAPQLVTGLVGLLLLGASATYLASLTVSSPRAPAHLQLEGNPAEHRGQPYPEGVAERGQGVGHLQGQLPGRRDDQRRSELRALERNAVAFLGWRRDLLRRGCRVSLAGPGLDQHLLLEHHVEPDDLDDDVHLDGTS